MADITYMFYLNRISNANNKNHWRVRNMIKIINSAISDYRYTAMQERGYVREFCNKEANLLEKQLEEALSKGQKRLQ